MWKRAIIVMTSILAVTGVGAGIAQGYSAYEDLHKRMVRAEAQVRELRKETRQLHNELSDRPLSSSVNDQVKGLEDRIVALEATEPRTIVQRTTQVQQFDTSTIDGQIKKLWRCVDGLESGLRDHNHKVWKNDDYGDYYLSKNAEFGLSGGIALVYCHL